MKVIYRMKASPKRIADHFFINPQHVVSDIVFCKTPAGIPAGVAGNMVRIFVTVYIPKPLARLVVYFEGCLHVIRKRELQIGQFARIHFIKNRTVWFFFRVILHSHGSVRGRERFKPRTVIMIQRKI